jgi:ABC-type transporter MlaC component
LEKKLANLMLAPEDKQKLQTYFKEFNKYLEQNYVAALAVASGKIDGQVDRTDYAEEFEQCLIRVENRWTLNLRQLQRKL